jgi:hypothetical protein
MDKPTGRRAELLVEMSVAAGNLVELITCEKSGSARGH